MKFRGKELPTPAVITGAAGLLWLGSFGLRAIKPDMAIGPAADTLMATCVAWFAKTRLAKNGQDDLLSQVLTTSVLPFVSSAHADPDTPAPGSPAPYTPKPTTYPPYTPPRPSTPPPAPKPGGLPWT